MSKRTTLMLALDARKNLLALVDESTNAAVLTHALNVVTTLDLAIVLLADRVPELADEAASLRPAFVVEDRVLEDWSA